MLLFDVVHKYAFERASVLVSMEQVVEELHRPARRNFPRRHVIVLGLDDLFQADLVDMQKYSDVNRGHNYILTVINAFSKYAWAYALKSKSAEDVATAFERILKKHKAPKHLQTDDGTEFLNKRFQSLMKKYKINHYSTYSVLKASIVERFNRTLKGKMWKMFSANGNYEYLDKLPKLIDQYNNTIHRTISMKPKDVTKKHEKMLLRKVYHHPYMPKKYKFQVGDKVRISKYKHIFSKGFFPNWTTEIFKIAKKQPTYPPTYLLEDYQQQPIEGAFYEYELQKAKYDDVFLIEKVLQIKGDRALVKWLGFDDSHNSWINKNKI